MYRWMLACAVWVSLARGQVITTVAGTHYVIPPNGVSALTAALGRADGVAVDRAGNIYVADSLDNVVVKSSGGVVTVVAGNGHAGFSGDGGPATSASLRLRGDNLPTGLAVDSDGSLYIADFGNNRIRKVSGGIITTVAGNGIADYSGDSGPATNASLNGPVGVAVDAAGALYIADTYNHAIRRVASGVIVTVAGTGSPGFGGENGPANRAVLNTPFGVSVDGAGNVYIADTDNQRVRRISGGTIVTVAGNGRAGLAGDNGPATNASLGMPVATAIDAGGNLYIADYDNNRIRKVTGGVINSITSGDYGGATGDGGPAINATFNNVTGIALDTGGNLYIADFGRGRIRRITGGNIATVVGRGSFAGDGGPATSAILNTPYGLAVDGAGALYIADRYNNRVRRIAGGIIDTIAGNGEAGKSGDGGPAISASLNTPSSVAVDTTGNLYIGDDFNNAIRRVTAGTISTIAGTGESGFGGDNGPALKGSFSVLGLAVDAGGNLYIADPENNRVRKIAGGVITTLAGTGVAGSGGDNGPATSAQLNHPTGVAVDGAGVVYIADMGNHRIRRVSGTTIATIAGTGVAGFGGDNGPATAAMLHHPEAVAVDSAGGVYVADTQNQRVRRIAGGTIVTVAGNGNFGYSGDGGAATEATLNFPDGVAVDRAGNLYIADAGNNRIRAVPAARPTYQASPQALTFTATARGAAPAHQVVRLSPTVAGLAYSATPGATWLTVTPVAGSMPATLLVSVDPGGLSAGKYDASVAVSVPFADPRSLSIPVTFNVTAEATVPDLAVEPPVVSFGAIQGSEPVTQSLSIRNKGGGALTFTVTAPNAPWLRVTPATGTATAATPATVSLTATPGSLAAGTYNTIVAVTGGGKTIQVSVSLAITAPTAILTLSQSALTFNAVAGGGVPLPQDFAILNTGHGSMNWSASGTALSGGNWLKLSAGNGLVNRPFLDVSTVSVTVDPASLGTGTYYGRIEVTAPAVNTPQVMTVILNVLPPGTALGTQVFPAGLIFTGPAGVTPGSQEVRIANPSARATSFISGMIGSGFDYLPTNATIPPDQPVTIHVNPDFTGLKPGTIQKGTITLQFADDSPPQTISVVTVVAPAGAAAATPEDGPGATRQATICAPLQVVFRAPQPAQGTITATLGNPTTMDVQVTDGCGARISPAENGSVLARFGDDSAVNMTHTGNGVWQGTWRPKRTGTIGLYVTAFAGADAGLVGGQTSVINALVSNSVTPLVLPEGVVHAATGLGGMPVAPGGLISIYGDNLSDSDGQTALPLPSTANGTRVMLGNLNLPILYTSRIQLNVQVPFGVPLNTQYPLTVQRGNTLSVPQTLVMATAQPGVFTSNQTGSGQGVITKLDGSVIRPGNAAAVGENIVIYATGLGSTTPKVRDGDPAPSATLANTDLTPVVTIGGRQANITFSGLTPGFAGLYQINAVVPAGTAAGDAVPVTVALGGQNSPVVTMAVR